MNRTYVVLIEGEILLNNRERAFDEQYHNAFGLAEALTPILSDKSNIVMLCDNQPHIGYVLYRSELSSHLLHPVPLDVAIADSQGAIGYVLTRAFANLLHEHDIQRHVYNVFTRVLVDEKKDVESASLRTIGPWFDRERAEKYAQSRGWLILEEPGYGYRRAVHSLPPVDILEMDEIKALVLQGNVVIAGGGGGVPVSQNDEGELIGVEELVEPEFTSVLLAEGLQAEYLWIVLAKENGFLKIDIPLDPRNEMNLTQLENYLEKKTFDTPSILSKMQAAARFLHKDGKEVLITNVRNLKQAVLGQSGLLIHR